MRKLFVLTLVLAACSGGDRSNPPPVQTAASATAPRGPDALMLRVPRKGGVPRVAAYPNMDSTVWTASGAAPALDHVLAFDPDAGLIAAADERGLPLWIDLHVGTVSGPTKGKLRSLESADGSTIYGAGEDGAVARYTPAGNWVFRPAQPARAVFPQSNGTVIILGGRNEAAKLWRMHPPDNRIDGTAALPSAGAGAGAPLGDWIYFARPPRSVVAVRARNLQIGKAIDVEGSARAIVATPSGDRAYVITDSVHAVFVIDPYQNRVMSRADLPGAARDLRIDPFGRYLLVRAAAGDSVWVMSVGTNRVVETVRSQWRGDLPLVAIDGAIATLDGADIVFHASSGDRRVAGGASDFWYPFVWNGLRPRAAVLDQAPAQRADTDTTAHAAAPDTTHTAPPPPPAIPDSVRIGFTVSFAALLDEARARDQASKISVNGQTARVVTGMLNGTAIYHVVLGPYPTRDEADRAGRASGQAYVVRAGSP